MAKPNPFIKGSPFDKDKNTEGAPDADERRAALQRRMKNKKK
jgi:hypothetical protein